MFYLNYFSFKNKSSIISIANETNTKWYILTNVPVSYFMINSLKSNFETIALNEIKTKGQNQINFRIM